MHQWATTCQMNLFLYYLSLHKLPSFGWLLALSLQPKLDLCAEASDSLCYTADSFWPGTSCLPFPIHYLPIYNSIFLPNTNHFSMTLNRHIRLQFELPLNKPFRVILLQPIFMFFLPWTLIQSTICVDLTKIPPSNNITYNRHIRSLLDEYTSHTVFLSHRSRSKHKSVYAYSIEGFIVS